MTCLKLMLRTALSPLFFYPSPISISDIMSHPEPSGHYHPFHRR